MAVDQYHYSTSRQFAESAAALAVNDANIVSQDDKDRIAAYNLYDGIYFNRTEALKIQVRGEDQLPIYMPSAKKIIEATSRYLCVGFDYYAKGAGDDIQSEADAKANGGPGPSGDEQPLTQESILQANTIEAYFASFFKREKIKSKFITQKRFGLIRGDAVWYLTADPKKEKGQRLSLHELDPRQYFPIEDPDDNTRVIGCHIVDTVQDPRKPEDKSAKVARRMTYRKEIKLNADGTPGGISITSERTCWEIGKWDDRNLDEDKMVRVPDIENDMELQTLPPQITALPVYHIQNNRVPNASFGLSQLSGMETLIFALNQSITDEDLTLVMQGLGMYTTNAAPPQNPDGSDGDWSVGPGQVIEVGTDQVFNRVTGVTSLSPFAEHQKSLDDALMQGAGVPEIAAGAVDVAVAESGVALMLQMGPILAGNAEKELEWILTNDQMFYDIVNGWLPAYEGIDPAGSAVQTIVDDPMPVNRDAKIQELILLYTSGVISLSMVVEGLMALGYSFPSNDPATAATMIQEEQRQKSIDMMGDPYAFGDQGTGDLNAGGQQGQFGGQNGNGNGAGQLSLGTT